MKEQQITDLDPNIHSVDAELSPTDFEHPLYEMLEMTRAKLDIALVERDTLWADLPKGTFAPPDAVIAAEYVHQLEYEISAYEKQIKRLEKWAHIRRQLGGIVDSFRN